MEVVIQESMFHNLCWGCGPLNERGLRIKSYWNGLESVCSWQPQDVFMAGPRHILNGGIIATVLDCHCICTAIAVAYEQEGREMGPEPHIWYATASMNVRYLKPTPIDQPVLLRATVTEIVRRKTVLSCSLFSGSTKTVEGEVVAVRVPTEWFDDGL